METAAHPEIFAHVRIVMGMVIGLGMTRILGGVAGLIQHPGRYRLSLLHLLWVGSILTELVLFWWWEFALARIEHWSFAAFAFLITYAVLLFLLSALLFPDSIHEYRGYEDYFIKRRRWFFAIFGATFVFDVFDTLLKGIDHWNHFKTDYLVQVPIGLTLCVIGSVTTRRGLQIGIALLHLAYQAYWVARVLSAP